ncbi:uncharacterized protein [Rutidosis leptorrhynchoides]
MVSQFVKHERIETTTVAKEDIDTIGRKITDGDAQYSKWRHHDPYIVPRAPRGSIFTRNPTPPYGEQHVCCIIGPIQCRLPPVILEMMVYCLISLRRFGTRRLN